MENPLISRGIPDERKPYIIRYEVSRPNETAHGGATIYVLTDFVRKSTERMRAILREHSPSITDDSLIIAINSFFPNGHDTTLMRQGTATRVLETICEDARMFGAQGLFVSLVMGQAMPRFLKARGFVEFKFGETAFYYRPLET